MAHGRAIWWSHPNQPEAQRHLANPGQWIGTRILCVGTSGSGASQGDHQMLMHRLSRLVGRRILGTLCSVFSHFCRLLPKPRKTGPFDSGHIFFGATNHGDLKLTEYRWFLSYKVLCGPYEIPFKYALHRTVYALLLALPESPPQKTISARRCTSPQNRGVNSEIDSVPMKGTKSKPPRA